MARSVRITGFPAREGGRALELEIPWWPADEFRGDPRFVDSIEAGAYLDSVADLSPAEAREIHLRLRPRALSGGFAIDRWQERLRPALAALDAAFGEREADYSRFRITVFEWESGLG